MPKVIIDTNVLIRNGMDNGLSFEQVISVLGAYNLEIISTVIKESIDSAKYLDDLKHAQNHARRIRQFNDQVQQEKAYIDDWTETHPFVIESDSAFLGENELADILIECTGNYVQTEYGLVMERAGNAVIHYKSRNDAQKALFDFHSIASILSDSFPANYKMQFSDGKKTFDIGRGNNGLRIYVENNTIRMDNFRENGREPAYREDHYVNSVDDIPDDMQKEDIYLTRGQMEEIREKVMEKQMLEDDEEAERLGSYQDAAEYLVDLPENEQFQDILWKLEPIAEAVAGRKRKRDCANDSQILAYAIYCSQSNPDEVILISDDSDMPDMLKLYQDRNIIRNLTIMQFTKAAYSLAPR